MLAVRGTLLYNGERIGRTSGTMTTTTTSFAEITDAVDKAKGINDGSAKTQTSYQRRRQDHHSFEC